MTAPEPFVQTEVQRVWEVLHDGGSVWTSNEEPTAEAAMAKAHDELAKAVAMQDSFKARHGEQLGCVDFRGIRFTAVRQRTSVTVNVYTTEYGDEIKFPDGGES